MSNVLSIFKEIRDEARRKRIGARTAKAAARAARVEKAASEGFWGMEHKEELKGISFSFDDDDVDDDEDKDADGHRTNEDGEQEEEEDEVEKKKKKLAPNEEWKRTVWRKRTGVKSKGGFIALQAEKTKAIVKDQSIFVGDVHENDEWPRLKLLVDRTELNEKSSQDAIESA